MKGSLYSVSDKAMFDAINQSKVTNPELKDLFLTRGMIASSDSKRETLAEYFSMFTHGYFDYKRLADILGTNTRKEKNTSTTISQALDSGVIETAVQQMANEIEHLGGRCEVEASQGGKSYNLKVYYHEFNYSNSEFKQLIKKEANISIDSTSEGVIVRHPQNKTVDEWKALLIAKMEVESGSELPTTNINLSHIDDPDKITKFFTDLISDIDEFNLVDVTDVFVYHPKEEPDEVEDGFEGEEAATSKVELGTHISKAALKGQNVLQSGVLKEFYGENFYISKVVWKAIPISASDDDMYEFEIQFSDPENRDDFSYLAKGYYSYIASKQYSKSRKSLPSGQERKLNIAIEEAAQRALLNLTGKIDE
jgi:hypothetical protein